MGSSHSSGSSSVQTLRHAQYVEDRHSIFLDILASRSSIVLASSPYAGYVDRDIEEDFFGVGYLISSFPSLYDMFGKFLAGMDIDTLWSSAMSKILSPVEVQDYLKEEREKIDSKVILETLPNFQREMRDKNAVMSSSYIIGKSMIEERRVKELSNISVEAIPQLFSPGQKEWEDVMNWDKSTLTTYALMMLNYFSTKAVNVDVSSYMQAEDKLWPFTVLEYERKGIGAFFPATRQANIAEILSFLSTPTGKMLRIIAWTAQGAYIGSSFGPYGTVIGGVVGFIVGLADVFLLSD